MRFRYVPVVFHKPIQLTESATGKTKFLFLNDGIVRIKAIPDNSRNLSKAQRSDLDLNSVLHLHFILFRSLSNYGADHPCPIPAAM